MQATFQTKIRDEVVYPVLDAIAAPFGRLMRRLFVDLHVHGCKLSECKKLYIARYGLTARQVNALACELKGKAKAAQEARKQRMETLRGQIAGRRLRRPGLGPLGTCHRGAGPDGPGPLGERPAARRERGVSRGLRLAP